MSKIICSKQGLKELDKALSTPNGLFAKKFVDYIVKCKYYNRKEYKISSMIEEQYVSFETAKLAKEKGFDEEFENMHVWNNFKGEILEDVSGYNMKNSHLGKNSYSAPTQSLLARWLREKYSKNVYVVMSITEKYIFWVQDIHSLVKVKTTDLYDTYEEAMEAGLQEALKLIK